MKARKEEMLMEDKDIIELYWNRSENAISESDHKYRNLCINVARNILSNTSDCEECLNDTYLTAWNIIPPKRPKFLGAFLCGIIRNHSMKRYEFLSRTKRKSSAVISIDELCDCIPDGSNTEDDYDEKELAAVIQEFLLTQDTMKRVMFMRRYWFMDTFSQIAARCGTSEENVKMTISRMRKNLKQYLEERGVV